MPLRGDAWNMLNGPRPWQLTVAELMDARREHQPNAVVALKCYRVPRPAPCATDRYVSQGTGDCAGPGLGRHARGSKLTGKRHPLGEGQLPRVRGGPTEPALDVTRGAPATMAA